MDDLMILSMSITNKLIEAAVIARPSGSLTICMNCKRTIVGVEGLVSVSLITQMGVLYTSQFRDGWINLSPSFPLNTFCHNSALLSLTCSSGPNFISVFCHKGYIYIGKFEL